MRYFSILVLALLVFPGIALGGQVYGKLKEAGRSVPEGIEVTVRCANDKTYSTKTDRFGSYRVYVGETGRCSMSVEKAGTSWKGDIRSYKNPVRYNFDLVKEGNKYVLRRK